MPPNVDDGRVGAAEAKELISRFQDCYAAISWEANLQGLPAEDTPPQERALTFPPPGPRTLNASSEIGRTNEAVHDVSPLSYER